MFPVIAVTVCLVVGVWMALGEVRKDPRLPKEIIKRLERPKIKRTRRTK